MGGEGEKRRRVEAAADTAGDDEEGEERIQKKSKSKKEKKGKHKKERNAKSRDEEKRLLKEAKEFLKQRLHGKVADADRAPVSKGTNVPHLTKDDYFARHTEFSAWLREERQQFFNELSSDETHQLFDAFVEVWNGRRLPARYYAGMVAAPRTQHQWCIRGAETTGHRAVGMAAALEEEDEAAAEARSQARGTTTAARARFRADQRENLDELLPNATGREAAMEKRVARREAAREREASPDLVKLPGGGDVMGGEDSFAAARAREAARGERRARQQVAKREELSHRVVAAAAAEDAKMAAFRALAASGPITIAKRQD